MLHPNVSPKRCAVYTRKSSSHGLQQDFNSLKAQKEVCSAYISSQAHRGWFEIPKTYEDPAQSGATLERPAMQDLIADVERGQVDVIVVYKLDRLSRSLLDFVRLLDWFDKFRVSFVCITQNFDTADSLGRLVMNVLLTFAQFEREMAADRVRDKKRAMAARGMWSGGRPPLGYDLVSSKLVVNEPEAAAIRQIYTWFLEMRSYKGVQRRCNAAGMFTKTWVTRHGRIMEGTPISTSNVRKFLMNPVYAGYVVNRDDVFEGLHQPIISRALWEQAKTLRQQCLMIRKASMPNELFDGLLYDCFGRKMKIDRQLRRGRWASHYRSYQDDWCRKNSVKRLRANATETERVIFLAIRALLDDPERLRSLLLELGRTCIDRAAELGRAASRRLDTASNPQLRSIVRSLIVRVEIARDRLKIVLRSAAVDRLLEWDGVGLFSGSVGGRIGRTLLLDVPCVGAVRLERLFRLPIQNSDPGPSRPPNKRLVSLIAEARAAQSLVDRLRDRSASQLASEMKRDVGFFMRLLSLNYLAPDIIAAIHDGRQPAGLTRKGLVNSNLPLDWALQRKLLGFQDQPPLRTIERY